MFWCLMFSYVDFPKFQKVRDRAYDCIGWRIWFLVGSTEALAVLHWLSEWLEGAMIKIHCFKVRILLFSARASVGSWYKEEV